MGSKGKPRQASWRKTGLSLVADQMEGREIGQREVLLFPEFFPRLSLQVSEP